MARSRRRRNRRRNRRGGKGKGAFKRKSARHGRTDAQMRAAAARRKNKTVKKTSGYHWDGKGKKPLVAAWNTKWKQTPKNRTRKNRAGPPPKGHAPAPPSQVSDDLKPISMGSKIASSNVNTAKLAKKTGVSISQVKAGKQAADKAAKIVAVSVKGAANQVAKEARKCTGPGKCSTQKSANESRGLCFSYGKDCMWEGKKAGQKRAHPTWRETATIAAERELEGEKGYNSPRAKTELRHIQADKNAPWAAVDAATALRRVAGDARTEREKAAAAAAAVKAGKQAADKAAKIVAGCPRGCVCDHKCPCPAVAAGGGRSRRRYAKNAPRAGPRRRSRRR